MKRRLMVLSLVGFVLLILALLSQAIRVTAYGSSTTTRASVASDGTQGNSASFQPAISGDGRYVAFESDASNLVPADSNGGNDIFRRDLQSGLTSLISVASDGAQANGFSESPSITADGRFVAFASRADNLVTGDVNGISDIFVHDTQSGLTTRVSVASDGSQGDSPVISFDGRFIAFASDADNLAPGDTNGVRDIFVSDTQSGVTTLVSAASDGTQGNGRSNLPAISGDGRYVGFVSASTNLVAGDTNGARDIFVHDTQSGQTTRVSVASDGAQAGLSSSAPAISADGRHVAFVSDAANLVADDTNGVMDAFVRDMQTGVTVRVSVASDGTQANRFSESPSITADGRYLAFGSRATNLIPGDTNDASDVFVHDVQTGWTARVSVAFDGTQSIHIGRFGGSALPTISSDGRYVAFVSDAANLVSGDTNGSVDVFVRDRGSAPLAVLHLPLVIQGASGGW